MQLITQTTHFSLDKPSVVAIGKFDGVHRGHKKLLKEVLEYREKGLQAVVFTFDPPPNVLFGEGEWKEITLQNEKRSIFQEMGMDVLIEFPLNRQSAATEPEDFIRNLLVGQMKARQIVAGVDVSFGNKGRGDGRLLKNLAKELEYGVSLIDKICYNGREISSTYVREEIIRGNMETVEKLLGEPYFISGTVVHGKRLGRTIGMPTANLTVSEEKLLPPNGVYYSFVYIEGKRYKGITNIGTKPTVSSKGQPGGETYIYDFCEDIYGKEIKVELLAFKRPEMNFGTVEALKMQMEKDIAEGAVFQRTMEGQGL